MLMMGVLPASVTLLLVQVWQPSAAFLLETSFIWDNQSVHLMPGACFPLACRTFLYSNG